MSSEHSVEDMEVESKALAARGGSTTQTRSKNRPTSRAADGSDDDDDGRRLRMSTSGASLAKPGSSGNMSVSDGPSRDPDEPHDVGISSDDGAASSASPPPGTAPPHMTQGHPDHGRSGSVGSRADSEQVTPPEAAGSSDGAADDGSVVVVSALTAADQVVELAYTNIEFVNSGAFGAVFRVRLVGSGKVCAIKKVPQDPKFKNRELQTMRHLAHPNLIELLYYFYSEDSSGVSHLCLVMDYLPSTVHKQARAYRKHRLRMPLFWVKLWTYQLLRGLAAIHASSLVHRDVKPQNLLVNRHTGLLKLCDFGTAKILTGDQPSTAYVCSRYYRAPELILGASHYSVAVDIWSAGCVLGELLLQRPLFRAATRSTSSSRSSRSSAPNARRGRRHERCISGAQLSVVAPTPLSRVLPSRVPPAAIDLLGQLLQYTPALRPACMDALAHPFFDELRAPAPELVECTPILTTIFDFTEAERACHPPELLAAIAGQPMPSP
ncbi:CMGC/GSK protein kinase [Thecamonas trahens ATCC 50062]|uniref:CMGC/GSK protein kinase n=1 Tax=Thecamonas trahens ATCC 50062 TaxID=461836 RepID=A0A0L0D1W1_THETB|nr:CMGC/GSK protein kinase [Thecamonas trahens ATCC 50062]KNC46344.1 CMGC/GSK protein kinase [Thecamonas trahens ATCC 50062]|eukprot:XP_013760637.1 CMGC/GSK protein kinase [Thecamonas trahens ATCC 50062]